METVAGLRAARSVTNTLLGGEGNDTAVGGNGYDTIYGGGGNDKLSGNDNEDALFGGAGWDSLNGGKHNDQLFGGDGVDTFVFKDGDGFDTIYDFQPGREKIDLRGVTHSNSAVAGVLPAVTELGDLHITATQEGALVDYGTGSILLAGVGVDELDASNFLFAQGPMRATGGFDGGILIF